MTPDTQGRFCAHCQKSVIDFTTWSDADLYAFFSKNSQSVCGRFQSQQLNRTIQLPVQKPTRLYRIAIALGLGLIFTQLPATHARPKPPLTEQNMLVEQEMPQNDTTGSDSLVIRGLVLDENRKPASGALVSVSLNQNYIGFSVVDTSGNFTFVSHREFSASDLFSLHVSYPDHLPEFLSRTVTDTSPISIQFSAPTEGRLTTGEVVRQFPVRKSPGLPTLTPDQIKRLTDNSKH